MVGFYTTGNVCCALIEATDKRSNSLAAKYLIPANTCGTKKRWIGSHSNFNRFKEELQ